MARDDVQVNFRMPAELKARIETAAATNKRSLTAEIVSALEEKFPPPTSAFEEAMAEVDRALLEAQSDEAKRAFLDALLQKLNEEVKRRSAIASQRDKRRRRIDLDDPPTD